MASETLLKVGSPGLDGASRDDATAPPLQEPIIVTLWGVAQRRKWLIAAIVAAALLLGLIVTLLMTPMYSATARLEISREQLNVTQVNKADTGMAEGQDTEFYKTQYSLLSARSLAERVVRTMNLAQSNDFFTAHRATPMGQGTAMTPAIVRAREAQAADILLDHVTIQPILLSRLVDVRYSSGTPELSARIANEWGQQFIAAGIDRRYSSTAYARQVLAKGLSDIGQRLEASERAARQYASLNDIVPLQTTQNADGKSAVDRTLASTDLDTLNTALAQATIDRVSAEANAKTIGSREQPTNSPVSALRLKRIEVAAERAKLLVQFSEDFPTVVALQQQLEALDRGIATEERRDNGGAMIAYRQAVSREQELRDRVAKLKGEYKRQEDASTQYNILLREVDTNRQLYNGLLQRSKEISISDVGATNVAVVDSAQVPRTPSSPSFVLNVLIALGSGLALAFVTVFALDQLDEGIGSASEVERQLGIGLLGGVPPVRGDIVDAIADVKSELSDATLTIWSSITLASQGNPPRSFMVTSARPSEGKSTTALSLAIVLGRMGKRVLLIDGDMRFPSIAGLTGLAAGPGLSTVLEGKGEALSLVHKTRFDKVDTLLAGPSPDNAGQLFSADRFPRLIADLVTHYDHVVIDSPPILGLSDAPLIANAVAGAIFVVEAKRLPVRQIRTALNRLNVGRANVLGLVLTKLEEAHSGQDYGYSYGYGRQPSA